MSLFFLPAVLFLAIDFLAVADLHDEDDEFLVSNRIDDPVVTLADTIQIIFTSQLLHTCGRGFSRRDISRLTIRF